MILTVSKRFRRLHETYKTAQMISASARTCSKEATKQFSGRMDIANTPNVLFLHDTYLSITKMHISFETQVCSLKGGGTHGLRVPCFKEPVGSIGFQVPMLQRTHGNPGSHVLGTHGNPWVLLGSI